MNCQNCDELVENGAAFCGNCGHPTAKSQHHAAQAVTVAIPTYAIATSAQQAGETKALLAVLLGVIGIVGSLFMALMGLVLGIAGIVMGTMSRNSPKRALSTAGIILSSCAVLFGMAVWAYAIKQNAAVTATSARTDPGAMTTVARAELTTPCYSVNFIDKLNVNSSQDSCNMSAYNGETLAASTNAYKVYSNYSQVSDANSFMTIAKTAIEKDIRSNPAEMKIVSQKITTFAGSPAYVVKAVDEKNNAALIEAAVMRKVGNGDNVFVIVHANQGSEVNLDIIESAWVWK